MFLYIASLSLLLAGVQSTHLIGLVGASQFHTQDALGQYSYGYNGGPSAKIESKTADGITRGGYSYIDANGILQSVNYISDPVNGFRVAATNLPQAPLPEVLTAAEALPTVKLAPEDVETNIDSVKFPPVENIPTLKLTAEELKLSPIPATKFNPELLKLTSLKSVVTGVNSPFISSAPALKLTPLAVPAFDLSPFSFTFPSPYIQLSPLSPQLTPYPGLSLLTVPDGLEKKPEAEENKVDLPINTRTKRDVLYSPLLTTFWPNSHQYEVKDNLGNYAYGYQNRLSAKTEVRSFGGLTSGAYSYVDANGLLQSAHYTADANGFRVAATNLPTA